jgi:hypothetical protein
MADTWSSSKQRFQKRFIEQRKSKRREIGFKALLLSHQGAILSPCHVIDLSEGGARLLLKTAVGMPETFTLVLSRHARTRRECRIKWKNELECGVEFIDGPGASWARDFQRFTP